jgi:hypothetical protein
VKAPFKGIAMPALHALLNPIARLGSTVALAGMLMPGSAGAATGVTPPADLSTWACTGVCGSAAADGDITLSPAGSARYGVLTTSGSEAFGTSPLQLSPNSRGNGTETNGSRTVSGAFQAGAGDRLDLQFNYVSTDGKGFDDYAWARVVNADDGSLVAWLFTARSSNSSTGKIVPGDVLDRRDYDPDAVIVDFKDYAFTSKSAADPIDWSPLGASNGTCWKDNAAGCGFTGWLHAQHAFAGAGQYRVEIGVVNWGDSAYDSGLAFDFVGLRAAAPVPEPASLALMAAGLGMLAAAVRRRRAAAARG